MEVSGFWDAVSMILTFVLVLFGVPCVVMGWSCGIVLARRTTKLPRHYMPPWRKLSRRAGRITIAGWICAVVAGIVGVWGTSFWKPLMIVLLFLWAVTALVSAYLWIVAWFKARQPDRFTLLPPQEADTEGVWPPPPR
jgi:hypothetical protein